MAEKIGTPTKEKTSAGRTVYITDKDIKDEKGNIFIKKGSRVSEISSTVGPIKGKYYNIPSIHAGKRYEDDELVEAIENNRLIPTSVHDSREEAEAAAEKRSNKLNVGGAVQSSSPPLKRPDFLTGSVRSLSPPLPRPKNLNQQTKDFLAPKQESKPDTSLGDTEFDMEILPEFINPIGRLGHNVKNYDMLFSNTLYDQPTINAISGPTKGYAGAYNRKTDRMSISDVREGALADYGLRESAVAKNPTFEHEAIHRGLNILRNYFGTQDAFIKRGMEKFDFSKKEMEAAAKFLFVNDLYSELDIEVLTELNDSKRLGLPYAQTYNERFVGREFVDSDKKVTEKDLKKYTDRADKVGPVLKMMALDRLQDENPEGGITDAAQNVPVKKYTPIKSKNFISKNIDKIKNMYKQRKLNKKYEKAATNMPSNFSGGGNVFKMGYSEANPDVLAYYDSAKDELIYIDGGRTVKNPDDKILTIGLRVGAFKMLGKGHSKGGDVKMERQMQMVFMDDGMDKDPVSGNDVPTGSLAEEVRDDVPAMLSEGEYVVPADVLRFYGMKFFEDLRTDAKMELARMEAEGRIGGEPVPEGEPMKAAGGALAKDGLSGGKLLRLFRSIKENYPDLSWDETIYIGKQLYQQGNKDRGIIDFDLDTMKNGGVVKANAGVTVGGGNTMTAEQQAAQAAAQAAASVTTSAGNTGYIAPIKPPSNKAFTQAVNVGGSSVPKTVQYINQSGVLQPILVGPDGNPLYGAPPGFVKASSPEGQKLMVQFGHAQADPNVAAPPETDLEKATPKPKKDDKSGQDSFDRAKEVREAAVAAQDDAIRRLDIGDRADDYKSLSFAQRLSLGDLEAKSMIKGIESLTAEDKERIDNILDNPAPQGTIIDALTNPMSLFTRSSKKFDPTKDYPATSSAFKGKISKRDKPYTTQRKTDSGYIDTIDLSARAAKDKDDFSTGTGTVYRDKEGNGNYA